MLATLVDTPFHRPGCVYEEKYDGYRILAYKEGDRVRLISRNDIDRTARYPEIATAVQKLTPRTLLLDGEAVAFDPRTHVSRFQLLQSGAVPPAYAVFDCLYVDGRDLRREALHERRTALEAAVGRNTKLRLSRRMAKNGLQAYELAKQKGMEGVVAKDESSPYVEGRSLYWLKFKVRQEEEFVIGGYTDPSGSRPYFGALHLGAYDGSDLRYVGKVGTGFTTETLARLHKKFQPLVRRTPPFVEPPRARGVHWLAPKLVAQIAFHEWTSDMRLRHPVFLGLRDDKDPRECLLPARRKSISRKESK